MNVENTENNENHLVGIDCKNERYTEQRMKRQIQEMRQKERERESGRKNVRGRVRDYQARKRCFEEERKECQKQRQ